jgi:hypothetical protein
MIGVYISGLERLFNDQFINVSELKSPNDKEFFKNNWLKYFYFKFDTNSFAYPLSLLTIKSVLDPYQILFPQP